MAANKTIKLEDVSHGLGLLTKNKRSKLFASKDSVTWSEVLACDDILLSDKIRIACTIVMDKRQCFLFAANCISRSLPVKDPDQRVIKACQTLKSFANNEATRSQIGTIRSKMWAIRPQFDDDHGIDDHGIRNDSVFRNNNAISSMHDVTNNINSPPFCAYCAFSRAYRASKELDPELELQLKYINILIRHKNG